MPLGGVPASRVPASPLRFCAGGWALALGLGRHDQALSGAMHIFAPSCFPAPIYPTCII